jgi:hypothetical protein
MRMKRNIEDICDIKSRSEGSEFRFQLVYKLEKINEVLHKSSGNYPELEKNF